MAYQTADFGDLASRKVAPATERLGFGRRVLIWIDVFFASAAVAHAWQSGRKANPRDLALFGVSREVEAKLLRDQRPLLGE